MKISWDGITWNSDLYYIYWWNWLSKSVRHFGPYQLYYDGPHWSFGLWFINFSWRLPCNKWNDRTRLPWIKNWDWEKIER